MVSVGSLLVHLPFAHVKHADGAVLPVNGLYLPGLQLVLVNVSVLQYDPDGQIPGAV
jgi:hypothetical protein